jgi:transcriptional antiterminator NusG
MWCAVHVRDGEEARTEAFVEALLPKSLNARCFHLTRNRRKKYGGQWQTIQERFLPGYVFIIADKPEEIYRELKKAPRPRLLFSREESISTLEEQEADFMDKIAGENGEIGISLVKVREDGAVSLLSGPLLQVEEKVRKVDLHKRIAEVEADFMGKRQVLYLGIEIQR